MPGVHILIIVFIRVAESNIVTTQRQKRQNPIGIGREPQVRGHRPTVEQRDQKAKEMDDTAAQSIVRI